MHVGVFVGDANLDMAAHHFMDLILERFRGLGHVTTVITPRSLVPTDLDAGLLHVAATRVPQEVLARIPADLPVVNRHVLDISKRRVSRMLVSQGQPVNGPVIVKSDANYAGINDFARLGRFRRGLRRLRSVLSGRSARSSDIPYEIYDSAAAVPGRVWRDRRRVVERFIPEREGDLYCLRKWVFLGATGLQVISRAPKPIVKATGSKHTFLKDPVPAELVLERSRLGFDYGKFDYVMHEGRAVLLDANSTPGISSRTEQLILSADELAQGLEQWIRGGGLQLARNTLDECARV